MEIQKEKDGTISVSGSITSDNAEEFRESLLKYATGKELVLDCSGLSYISSAGLRELVRIIKQGKTLSLINVNPSVYEILKMTGLADHIHVERALRKVSVEGLPLIGEGVTASVYRLDDDKVIKVYLPGISRKIIDQEYEITRQGFLSGLDTMVAYDIVSTEKGLATVFENVGEHTLIYYMKEDHSKLQELVTSFGLFVKEQHKKSLDVNIFGSAKERTIECLSQYEQISVSKETSDHLVSIVERMIPECDEFAHMDCHAGNVMVKGGHFVFIDVGKMCCGHLIYDMMTMFLQYRFQSFHHLGEEYAGSKAKAFSSEERLLIWNSYFQAVTGILDEKLRRKAEAQISVLAGLQILEARGYVKRNIPDEFFNRIIEEAIAYDSQGCDPLVF